MRPPDMAASEGAAINAVARAAAAAAPLQSRSLHIDTATGVGSVEGLVAAVSWWRLLAAFGRGDRKAEAGGARRTSSVASVAFMVLRLWHFDAA